MVFCILFSMAVNVEKKQIQDFVKELSFKKGISMALQDDIQVLIDFGVFNEGAVSRLASVIRTVQTLSFPAGSAPAAITAAAPMAPATPQAAPGVQEAPPASQSPLDRVQEAEPEAETKRKRGRLDATPQELKKLYVDEGLTAKKIAEKYGCAAGTVAIRLQKLGIGKREKAGKGKGKKK